MSFHSARARDKQSLIVASLVSRLSARHSDHGKIAVCKFEPNQVRDSVLVAGQNTPPT